MKKSYGIFISVFLIIAMMLPLALTASAADCDIENDPVVYEPQAICHLPEPVEEIAEPDVKSDSAGLFASRRTSTADLLFEIEELMKDAIANNVDSISIEHLNIPRDDINLHIIRYFSPYLPEEITLEPFISSITGYYTHIDISSTMTADEYLAYCRQTEKKVNEISALLEAQSNDFNKALTLHDYFVYNCEYDYDNYVANTIPEKSYRCSGLLRYNKGVCQAYSYAFMYFLSLYDIECHVTTSVSMNHAWNIINIDGEYYQVDVTWDDPVPDRVGKVRHHFFLVSDSLFSTGNSNMKPHYGWDRTDLVCSSTKYDTAYWKEINTVIGVMGDFEYYVSGSSILQRDRTTGEEKEIASLGVWRTWEQNASWPLAYSGFTMKNGEIYYNTPTKICKLNLSDMSVVTVLEPDTSEGFIYGSYVQGNSLNYVISKGPTANNFVGTTHTYVMENAVSLTPDKQNVALTDNNSYTLSADGLTGSLSWTSSNPGVAAVDKNGVLTTKSAGKTVLTVTDKNGTSIRCNVTVYHIHDFSPEWTVDFEPTATTDGQKSRHCSSCDEVTDIIIIARPVEIIDSTKKFTDVKDSWAKTGIDYVVSYGYMNGTGDGSTFSPGGTMSRSMIVTVLYRIARQPDHSGKNPFTDIEKGWYYDAVLWAYEKGIVTGTSKTTFAPSGDVTREQMATFLYRFAKNMGYDILSSADLTAFPDASKVGSWAYDALAWANAEGLITGAVVNGETILNPQGVATREQVATILMRFCSKER